MDTITKTRSKSKTKLAIATVALFAAAGAAFIVTPFFQKGAGLSYNSYCIVGDSNSLPAYGSPDIGKNYTKKNLGTTSNLLQTKKLCTNAVYVKLVNQFCSYSSSTSKTNLIIGAVGYTSDGTDELAFYGCANQGCTTANPCIETTPSNDPVPADPTPAAPSTGTTTPSNDPVPADPTPAAPSTGTTTPSNDPVPADPTPAAPSTGTTTPSNDPVPADPTPAAPSTGTTTP